MTIERQGQQGVGNSKQEAKLTQNSKLKTQNCPPPHSPGKLYGVGIGPGDPELLTLKAHRILTSVPVVAYPILEHGKSLARSGIADFICSEQIEIPMPMPFSVERSAQPYYDTAAEQIAAHLKAGRDVAVLCEGNPMLYGTFMYLFQRLAERFPTEVVPGISSTLASAAMLGAPLTFRNDVLSIMPATLDDQVLRDRLTGVDAAVIIQCGRHFAKVRTILKQLGLLDRALYIERATQPNQRVVAMSAVDPADVPYWSLILIPSQTQPQQVSQAYKFLRSDKWQL